jgi:hypothetical protein
MPKSAAETSPPPKSVDRKRADRKIHEQKKAGAELSARHAHSRKPPTPSKVDAQLDKALKDSFPSSDPVSFLEAAPLKQHDKGPSAVESGDNAAKKQD